MRSLVAHTLDPFLIWGLITGNPVQAIRPPKVDAPQLHIPTPEQVPALVKAARGTVWDVPLLLAAVTGARRGEVLAMAWSEVDLESGRIRIVRSLHDFRVEPSTLFSFVQLRSW